MSGVAESLLALCFGDLDALGTTSVLRDGPEQGLDEFEGWSLPDLLVERYDDLGHATLRYEVRDAVSDCGGDPLTLLYLASRALDETPVSAWNERFPLSIFAGVGPRDPQIGFDIADSHLHSGASVPLPLFFSALASGRAPVDGAALAGKVIRSTTGGRAWDLHTLLAATRWALRLLRCEYDGERLSDIATLAERGFDLDALEEVHQGTFWASVKREATTLDDDLPRPRLASMERAFEFNGLCAIDEVFWHVARREECDFLGRRAFLLGIVRACVALSATVTARPGDGLARFVDRFDEMGLTRDAALGELKGQLTSSILDHVAASSEVVGAEFRKTVIASRRKEFKRKVLNGLEGHHRGFGAFVERRGRAMALSMPVGFIRRPWSGVGGDWTDMQQLREAVEGYHALRLLLVHDDGTLTKAISSIDVAGDEYGSASWPFAAVAELLQRAEVELGYTIHAGEAFYSPLNGARRVGELFLADRRPDRIGHALALADGAAAAVCAGKGEPPRRIGDAICDLAWCVTSDCGDTDKAGELLYALACGSRGKAFPPDVWEAAYRALFSVDALRQHEILCETGGQVDVSPPGRMEKFARRVGTDLDRAVAALAWGAGPEIAHADVKALVPERLKAELRAFDAATAPAAREHVLGLVREHGTIIEACPTSNVRLAKLPGVHAHPIWDWASGRRRRVKVAVGSDDPLIFGATIADEFRELLAAGDHRVVREIARTTVACCSGNRRLRLADFEQIATRAKRGSRGGRRAAP